MANGANKKYLPIGIIIAAAVGLATIAVAAAVVSISDTEDDGLIDPGIEITDADPGGIPVSPELQPFDSQQPSTEQGPSPGDQASIVVIPDSANAGAQVTVRGTSFAPNDAIAILVDKQPVETRPELVLANVSGEFSAIIVVPEQIESGEYEVDALGKEVVARTTFTVN